MELVFLWWISINGWFDWTIKSFALDADDDSYTVYLDDVSLAIY